MDRIMNTHLYSSSLLKNCLEICAYNAYKKEYVKKMFDEDMGEHDRTTYLVKNYPILPVLMFSVPFLDEDGQMKELPAYVVEQITEAIGSINIYPNPLTMKVAGDNYILSVTYTNEEIFNENEDYPTTVLLEYTFDKNTREFEGYFAKSIENECWLPDYEITPGPGADGKKETLIRVKYRNDSSLLVNITSDIVLNVSHSYKTLHLPDELQNYTTNRSLKDAVLKRIFPSKAHIYKYLVNEKIADAEVKFCNDLLITPLNWLSSSSNNEPNLYAKYILTCYGTNKSQPIVDKELSDDDKMTAMKILIKKYPFFTTDDQDEGDVCLLDLWIQYFNRDLNCRHARRMKLSDTVRKNLTAYCSSNPKKYSKVFELFPSVLFPIVLKDFERRFDVLKLKKHKPDELISSEDVVHFNRIKSSLPVKWRSYLRSGTYDKPAYEVGNDIMKKMRDGIPAANAIEKINYLDIENEEYPLSVFELMNKIATVADDLENLYPERLQEKFQTYRFSENYKMVPTDDDCLAVRYTNVYRDKGYVVPKIPDDFFDRFGDAENAEANNDVRINCVFCNKRIRTHMFPSCKHFCVCERCSYKLLSCPLCNKGGNPQKIFI